MSTNKADNKTNLKYPSYSIMGNARMPDGRDVMIMSPEQWNTYCFNFNKLNSVEQPAQLMRDMEFYAQENQRKRQHLVEKREKEEYNASWVGKTTYSLKMYFMIAIPLFLILALYQDASAQKSPRRNWWKNRIIGIPDFDEWLMFEIPAAWKNQVKKEKEE